MTPGRRVTPISKGQVRLSFGKGAAQDVSGGRRQSDLPNVGRCRLGTGTVRLTQLRSNVDAETGQILHWAAVVLDERQVRLN